MARRKKNLEEISPEGQEATEGAEPETDLANPEGEGEGPEGGASPSPDFDDELLSPAERREMEHLDRRHEQASRDLFAKEREKSKVNSKFNGEISEIKAEIETILSEMTAIREHALHPQGRLPLGDEAPRHETEHPEDGECGSCHHQYAAHFTSHKPPRPRPCAVDGCGCHAAVMEAEMKAEQDKEATA